MAHRPSSVQPPGRDPVRRAWFIFLAFFLMGAAGTAYYARQGIRNYRAFHVYQPAQCSITSFRMLTNTFSAGLGRSGVARTTYTPEYAFRHVLNGKTYAAVGYDNLDGRMGQEESFDVGSTSACWYDPADPAQVVLVRHFHPIYYAIAVVPLLFLLIGGNFLWLALGPKAKIKIADGGRGDVLAVRLAPDMSQGTALASMVVILVVWSLGLLGAVAWIVSEDGGSIDMWGFFMLLAIGAEYWLVRFVASAVRAMKIPDPIVEIDHEPLARGDKVKVSVRQHGPAHFDIFRIAVACERHDQRGTAKENQQVLLLKKNLDVAEAVPFQNALDAEIPADAPVSDKAIQSFTTWKVVVKRTKKGFLSLDREYVFRVV
jgi:hypothetical protein